MYKKPLVLGICAANSGSGKTYFIERLIPELSNKGYLVSAIKHAHHTFDIDKPGKDSFRLREAGAKQTLIFNDSRAVLITESKEKKFDLEKALEQIHEPADIILIEGLKNMQIPKIEIFRKGISKAQLHKNDSNVIAVVSDDDIKHDIPSFNFNNFNQITNFIIKLIQK